MALAARWGALGLARAARRTLPLVSTVRHKTGGTPVNLGVMFVPQQVGPGRAAGS